MEGIYPRATETFKRESRGREPAPKCLKVRLYNIYGSPITMASTLIGYIPDEQLLFR